MQTQADKQGIQQRAWLIGAVALGLLNLGGLGLLAARAAPGMSGGRTRDMLTFVGTLKGVSGTQAMVFSFFKDGNDMPICATQVTAAPDTNGAFSVDLPLDQDPKPCPTSLFDGSDVRVSVRVGGLDVVAPPQYINPVPYARYADRVGTPDCPLGYEKSNNPKDTNMGKFVVCQRKGTDGKPNDEMVRVGRGQSAFWIDRYEASVWDSPDGTGKQYGLADPYPPAFLPNGQGWLPMYALSKADVQPSANTTWFQAMTACAWSRKVLPGRQEWLHAAWRTPDDSGCNTTDKNMGKPLPTGMGAGCASQWGAQDMIGNLWEWTDEWYASVGAWDESKGMVKGKIAAVGNQPWPSDYSGDATYNITTHVASAGADVDSLPAAALRGGRFADGPLAGVFALYLSAAPSLAAGDAGFRCMIRR